jgi:hypothetical protein
MSQERCRAPAPEPRLPTRPSPVKSYHLIIDLARYRWVSGHQCRAITLGPKSTSLSSNLCLVPSGTWVLNFFHSSALVLMKTWMGAEDSTPCSLTCPFCSPYTPQCLHGLPLWRGSRLLFPFQLGKSCPSGLGPNSYVHPYPTWPYPGTL